MMAISMVITNSGIPKWEIQVAEKKTAENLQLDTERKKPNLVVSWMMKKKKQVEKLPSCFSHSCALIVEVLFTSTPIATNPAQEPKLWSRNW